MTHTPVDPTGEQILLTRGDVTAHIAQVGAALRGLSVGGTNLVPPYPLGRTAPFGSGIVLVPWPNRIRDGEWTMTDPHGETYDETLPISEPARGTAIHGLLRWAPYVIEQGDGIATLRAAVIPQNGYPFALETSVTYELTDTGVTVTHTFENVGSAAAPVGVGTHPFFYIEGTDPRDLTITLPASTYFEVDERLLPLAEIDVDSETDLRSGKRLGDVSLDTAFGGLSRDDNGLAGSTLSGPDGTLTVWQDEAFDYLQVFTTDAYPDQPYAVAIEPMTMPAEAFNTGQGVRWIEPGESWSVSWGVAYSSSQEETS
ncbi:aldose 1-epimerase family protein [Microbacterium amylolyticum]|uniref:Aldose 1-epimerase n=1 Tax=Microbacterium amylolyticum TaxID=936337 RepID=A0ABS4ZGK8_9MICO|nr:aldose 1-epimerase family protein [Microbacterium amylolyticum]MBP2436417.1 aldose 1-epimerase [Microbacterium amylolyticum]